MSYRAQIAEVDLGNLLVEDKCPLDQGEINESAMVSMAYECSHRFLELFYQLPTEMVDSISVTLLPKPLFRLPREKKIPSTRELTKWDRFAKLKGIKNRKKPRKVWDPESKSWKPRWGKDRIDDLKDKWVLEVPDNADPYEDQFEKLAKAKKERQAKNELQRLRNIARTVKAGAAPPIGVLAESQSSKNELNRAIAIAKKSDASLGRFSTTLNARKISKKFEKKYGHKVQLSQVAQHQKKRSKEMMERGYQMILVLEDDLRFAPGFVRNLITVVSEANEHVPDWDLLYIGRKRMSKNETRVPKTSMLAYPNYTYWTLGYILKQSGAQKLLALKPLGKMIAVDEYLPVMFNRHPRKDWLEQYSPRDVVALSAEPLLLEPQRYTGEQFYVSDTEDSSILNLES